MSFWWAKWCWALTPDRSSTNEGKWGPHYTSLYQYQQAGGDEDEVEIQKTIVICGCFFSALLPVVSKNCFVLVSVGVSKNTSSFLCFWMFLDVSGASRRTVSCRRWIPRLSHQNSKGWGYQISRCRRTWMTPIGEAFIQMGLTKIAITWNPLEFWTIQEFSCAGDQQHHHRKHGHGYGSTAKMNRTERNEVPQNETYADPTWCGKTPFHFTHFCRWKLLAQPRKIVVENVLTTLTGGSWELGWDWRTDCWWKKTWAKFKVACILNGHYLSSSTRLFTIVYLCISYWIMIMSENYTKPAVPLVNHHFSFELPSGKLTWLLKITIFNG